MEKLNSLELAGLTQEEITEIKNMEEKMIQAGGERYLDGFVDFLVCHRSMKLTIDRLYKIQNREELIRNV